MNDRGFLDIFRTRYPNKQCYTWHRTRPNLLMERLDYILVSYTLSSKIIHNDIGPAFMSDHSIPYIWLDTDDPDFGRGYWKLNTKLLNNEAFKNECREIFEKTPLSEKNPKTCWELIKLEIRGAAIKHAARAKKSTQNKLLALERKEAQLIQTLNESDETMFVDTKNQLTLIQKDIEEIYSLKTQRSCLENAINWFQAGEKSSSYFFALEKQRPKKALTSLRLNENLPS